MLTLTHKQAAREARYRADQFADEVAAIATQDEHGIKLPAEAWLALCAKYPKDGTVRAVPAAKWPWRIWLLSKLKSASDRGVGDTAARVLGGDRTKRLYERLIGRPCGCSNAQARLNRRYPYERGER